MTKFLFFSAQNPLFLFVIVKKNQTLKLRGSRVNLMPRSRPPQFLQANVLFQNPPIFLSHFCLKQVHNLGYVNLLYNVMCVIVPLNSVFPPQISLLNWLYITLGIEVEIV